jgi:hypothetical protein
MPMKKYSPLIWFAFLALVIAGFTALGPAEATLGTNARVVYLHGAWVWAALAAFVFAGALGLVGFLLQVSGKGRPGLHAWSRALGRTGLLLWITYLPVSLWAMETNWNGLFLAEPRWRVAVIFAITGVLLQVGLTFLPVSWSSFWNFWFIIALFGVLGVTENVMHPPSPMLDSEAWRIQVFYGGLVLLLLLAAWQMARGFRALEK